MWNKRIEPSQAARPVLIMARAFAALLAVLALGGGVAAQAYAWNESGHRIIGAAAAMHMSPELKASVAAALRAHPRYAKDFERYRPRNLGGLTEFEWLLGQAAQWPDRIRRFNNEPFYRRNKLVEKYHRGRWHYINLPVYLREQDAVLNIADPRQTINVEDPDNVLEALGFIRAQLGDSTVSLADKGLWISWALHLIADVHQPLHTTAMFERARWPGGDRGGNEVKIKGSGKDGRLDSLHYYWDSAISNVRESSDIKRLVGVLNSQQVPLELSAQVDPVLWIQEGNSTARRVVYGPLLEQLHDSSEVEISTDYTQQAHAVALQKAALAARRSALWLKEGLEAELKEGSGDANRRQKPANVN